MNAICLVIDRLHYGYLGCYGNTWIATPAFDRLAARSFVFDQAIVDSPDLAALCESYWSGSSALRRLVAPSASRPSLFERLSTTDVTTALVTDDDAVAALPSAAQFDQLIRVPLDVPSEPAPSAADAQLVRLFAEAAAWIEDAAEPYLLWIHAGSLGRCWDAPIELRSAFAEPDDPPPAECVEPPELLLGDDYDPDELLAIAQAYAGQTALADLCLGQFLAAVAAADSGKRTLVAALGARGFPLGEHRRVGPYDDALHSELVQFPLFVALPDGAGAMARTQQLVQPADLAATLADWLAAPPTAGLCGRSLLPLVRDEQVRWRDRVATVAPSGERALRTPAWHIRWPAKPRDDAYSASVAFDEAPQLFAKPDDRWEVNDVADRCAEAVDELARTWDETVAALATDAAPEELPELPDLLRYGFD